MDPERLVCFAHGKESGPWGTKITRLAVVARRHGFTVISPDYSHTPDARERLRQLETLGPRAGKSLVLVGSSMGGWVSAMACARLSPQALMLLAPVLYLPGIDMEPTAIPGRSCVVHGWRDALVPAEDSLRFARRHRAALHLLDSGHDLIDQLPIIELLFANLLLASLA